MLGELYTEISNRLATFVKEWENLENDEVRPSNRQSRIGKGGIPMGATRMEKG
jgi:hypothetical protein